MSSELFHDDGKISNYDSILFEQYKLYVSSAEHISDRRSQANTFFISANIAIFTIATWFGSFSDKKGWLICVVGIVISIAWFATLRSYKHLNSCKYHIINRIEEKLPLAMYECEWEKLKSKTGLQKHLPFSFIEAAMPCVFAGLYLLILIFFI
mgnify:CR=1 FL=1